MTKDTKPKCNSKDDKGTPVYIDTREVVTGFLGAGANLVALQSSSCVTSILISVLGVMVVAGAGTIPLVFMTVIILSLFATTGYSYYQASNVEPELEYGCTPV